MNVNTAIDVLRSTYLLFYTHKTELKLVLQVPEPNLHNKIFKSRLLEWLMHYVILLSFLNSNTLFSIVALTSQIKGQRMTHIFWPP